MDSMSTLSGTGAYFDKTFELAIASESVEKNAKDLQSHLQSLPHTSVNKLNSHPQHH